MDTYTKLRQGSIKSDAVEEEEEIDPRLLDIVERLFKKCVNDGQHEQAVGLALESHRMDLLEEAIMNVENPLQVASYTLKSTQKSIASKTYRDSILKLIVALHEKLGNKDMNAVIKCLMILDEPEKTSDIIIEYLKGSEEDVLMAYQLGFDIFESEQQSFAMTLRQKLSKEFKILEDTSEPEPKSNAKDEGEEDMADETTALMEDKPAESDRSPKDVAASRLDKILSGDIPMELERQFLAHNNSVDLQILKNIKSSVEPRNSVCHGATVFANAMMNAGTSNDSFLRDNLDWLAKATNWSKFSATAGLGVIHKGNIKNSRTVMSPYLPSGSGSTSPYSEGGALYALGIIHSNHGSGVRDYLLDGLKGSSNEVIQHGACLGLGMAGIGSEDSHVFDEVRNVLYNDNAIAGEAAALAMGLIYAGSGTEYTEEMLSYAHETQHEKIIRGLSIGLAAIQYGREEKADTTIEAMTHDQDPIIRYGGMFTIGMAYCGTGDNAAMQKLLHFAVSDVSDDVRRAAVMSLGFVLAGHPELCVRTVSLLAESYNPHVRYGSAIAVGISGAGTGCKDSLTLLEPMLKDAVDFVQQGALIASSLVLIEQPESRQKKLRDRINELHGSRAVELMTRMGSILAAGILDAAGRNATVSLFTDLGGLRRSAVIGLAVFLQHWYWYPLMHAISLAIKPTALIGVDSTLAPPKDFVVTCNCKKSLFAYPSPVAVEDKKSKDKLPTAILSTTARRQARTAKKDIEKKKKEETSEAMEIEDKEQANKEKEEDEPPVAEPSSYDLENPARVVPAQRKYLVFQENCRWEPLRPQSCGFVVLKDNMPGEKVIYATGNKEEPKNGKSEGEEPAPPEPFEYIPS